MTRAEYLRWTLKKRINYSDYYTYNLNALGWDAEEFILNDPVYVDKVANELSGSRHWYRRTRHRLAGIIRPARRRRWLNYVVDAYISYYKPDVILVREKSSLESAFWSRFSEQMLLVDRIATIFPPRWSPRNFDLILTTLVHYKKVFESNYIPTNLLYDGFDERILAEIGPAEKSSDVSHTGMLGEKYWSKRTQLFEFLADKCALNWYGYGVENFEPDSPIAGKYRGPLAGLPMYKVYKQSRIVINDYADMATGLAVNQRLFEVLGIGSFLLTREAENLNQLFPRNLIITFKNNNDCLDKIKYFLKNEKEREEIAARGQEYLLANCTYEKRMVELDDLFRKHHKLKFASIYKKDGDVVS